MDADSVILLASVRVDNMCITKAFRFDTTTTVKDALIKIAEKCSLQVSESTLLSSYVICFATPPKGAFKYLTNPSDLLLESNKFSDRDEIEVRQVVKSVTIHKDDGTSKQLEKIDIGQKGSDFLETVCKNEFCTPGQWELYIKVDDKEISLDTSRSLVEQGVSEGATFIFRFKKHKTKKLFAQRKSKTSSTTISGPLFVKHSKDDSVLYDEKEGSGSPIFGFPLKRALERSGDLPDYDIPPLVSAAIEFILENALNVQGIFRISAKSEQVDMLKLKYDDAEVDVSFSKDDDPHLVCSIFKQYLRDLPEPVIPYKYYQDFIQLFLQHEDDHNEMMNGITELTKKIPTENYVLLKKICLFLQIITKYEDVNKMDAKNLATVFGPNLIRSPDSNDMIMLMKDAPRLSTITSIMISNAKEIFGCDEASTKTISQLQQKFSIKGYTRVLYNFDTNIDSEISLKKDDILVVLSCNSSGWWLGSHLNSSYAGYFPSNFCTEMFPTLERAMGDNNSKQNDNLCDNIDLLKQKLEEEQEKVRNLEENSKKQQIFFTQQISELMKLLSPQ